MEKAERAPVALITGGDGDLANAIALRLRAVGWEVHAPGRDVLDVESAGSVERWFEGLEGPLDLLVNNAGRTRDAPFLRLKEADWDEVLRINLKGAFLCARQAMARMAGENGVGGNIIQVGSFSALSPPAGQAAYAAAKAGLVALTQSLAAEGAEYNVRVNCILPGFLLTRMTRDLPEAAIERARSRHLLRRFNTVEDVARFLETLVALHHVSGQSFQLDSRLSPWT